VTTQDGNVSLTGQVNSQMQADRAADLAGNIDGVKHVENQLVVASK